MMQVFTEVFYLMAFIFLYIEMESVVRPEYVIARIGALKLIVDTNTRLSRPAFFYLFTQGILYPAWVLLGLLTVQTPLFAVILLLSLVKKKEAWWFRIDGFITTTIILFMLINHYHLKIDLNDLLLRYL